LSDGAKRALAFAQDEAARLNHNHVGPVHLLAGLVREEEGLAAQVFSDLGVALEQVRNAMASIFGASDAPTAASDITLIPHAQRVMQMAIYESHRLGHSAAGPEHLLLALAREGEAITLRVLESLGLDVEDVRARILGRMRVPPSYGAAENATPGQGPYERFDDASRRTLAFAQEEAVKLGHHWVGGEHLLLGLARVAEVSASDAAVRRVFTELDLTLGQLRAEVTGIQAARQADVSPGEVKFTGMSKLIIELAIADAGPGRTIRPQHILRAIGTAGDGIAGRVLARLGATPERVRAVVDRAARA
jgi:ATP-dependent Clp protease ATP-binding subunit ClpA